MADPFSISTGVVGILSFGLQVAQGVLEYYDKFQHQYSNVNRTLDKTYALLDRLRQLNEHLEGQRFHEEDQKLVEDINEIIDSCEECIKELDDELSKFKKAKVEGVLAAAQSKVQRIAYPFREGTLKNLEDSMDNIMEQLSQALELLQLKKYWQNRGSGGRHQCSARPDQGGPS